MEVCLALAH